MALILVIDDQSSIRTILAMVLKNLGHEVVLVQRELEKPRFGISYSFES